MDNLNLANLGMVVETQINPPPNSVVEESSKGKRSAVEERYSQKKLRYDNRALKSQPPLNK